MQENVRSRVKLDELLWREEADKMHVARNSQSGRKHLQFRLQRSFAGNEKFGARMVLLENGECAQTGGDAFFRNQPAGLHDAPAAVRRRWSIHHRKFVQWNTGAIDAQLLRRTTELGETIGERLRAGQHEGHERKQAAQFSAIIRDLFLDRDVRTVKRDHARLVPLLDERKQVHTRVAKINVHDIGPAPFQKRGEHLVFAAINNRRLAFDEFEVAVPQQVHPRLWDDFDLTEGKTLRVLNLLCDDKGAHTAQRFDLAVNRSEERRVGKECRSRWSP